MKSAKEKAIKFLENIQKECIINSFGTDYLQVYLNKLNNSSGLNYSDILRGINPSMTEEEKGELESYIETTQSSTVLLTKYEHLQPFMILNKLFKTIDEAAEILSLKTKNNPYFGTAYSKEYNAFACEVPDTEEHLIIIESEMFMLANLLSKIIASCLPEFKILETTIEFSTRKEDIRKHIKDNPIILKRFIDLTYNSIYLGRPSKAEQYYIDEQLGRLTWELLNSLELFVVGHEYGHITGNHLKESKLAKSIVNQLEIERISPDWEMEYEADATGLELLLHSLGSDSLPPFSYMGPELFFTFLDINERARMLFNTGKESRSMSSDTHPPTIERRKKIRAILEKKLHSNQLDTYITMSIFIENALEILWDGLKKERNSTAANNV